MKGGSRTPRSDKTGRSKRTRAGRASADGTRTRPDSAPAVAESAAQESGADVSAPASGNDAPVLPEFHEPRVSKLHGKKGGQPFIVLTGLSGSGKSQAIRALEDLGYFCVDNLPTTLIPMLAKLSLRAGGDIGKVAIVVDVREGGFLSSFPKVFKRLRATPRLNPILIFLEASHDTLVRRFSETRRPHPLAADRPVSEGIRDERSRLNVIRELADEIVDTSDMTVHELRRFFMGLSMERSRARLVLTLLSFGFKHGVPVDADLVFDVRCLPNPHFVPTLRRRTGRDRAVVEFMERDTNARAFMDRLEDYLKYVVPYYIAEGKSYLTVAIGCTGGRHRSVMIAERLRKALAELGVAQVRVRHRDVGIS
jgi:RNase adapter protein RapZ